MAEHQMRETVGFVFAPTHKHLKTGGLYQLVARGTLEADMSDVAIYKSHTGQFWVRPWKEFMDGRFASLEELVGHGD